MVQVFLSEIGGNSVLDENVSKADDHFIESLRMLPGGTIAAHYTELWNSLNTLEAQNLPREELLMFLDSAIVNFTGEFTASVNRDLRDVAIDPELNQCLFSGSSATYNRALAKITELFPEEDAGAK